MNVKRTGRLEAMMNTKAWNANKHTGLKPYVSNQIIQDMRVLHSNGYFKEVLELGEKHSELNQLPEFTTVIALSHLGLGDPESAINYFKDSENFLLERIEKADNKEIQLVENKERSIAKLVGVFGNFIAAYLKVEDFYSAEAYALKARELAPKNIVTHLNLLAFYTRTQQENKVLLIIDELPSYYAEWINDQRLIEYLETDVDLRDVKQLLIDSRNIRGYDK